METKTWLRRLKRILKFIILFVIFTAGTYCVAWIVRIELNKTNILEFLLYEIPAYFLIFRPVFKYWEDKLGIRKSYKY